MLAFSISVLIRYIGIIFYLIFLMDFLLARRCKSIKRLHLIFLLLPIVIIVLLFKLNFNQTNTFTGSRDFLNRSLILILKSISGTIIGWIVPLKNLIKELPVLILLILTGTAFYQRRKLIWHALFTLYLLVIITCAYFTDIEFDERLFVPIYPVFLIITFSIMDHLYSLKNNKAIYYLVLLIWLTYNLIRLFKNFFMWL